MPLAIITRTRRIIKGTLSSTWKKIKKLRIAIATHLPFRHDANVPVLTLHIEPYISQVSVGSTHTLPDEVLINVFSYLSPADLSRAARVCHQWNTLAADRSLWRTLAHQRWRHPQTLTDKYLESAAGVSPPSLSEPLDAFPSWKYYYEALHCGFWADIEGSAGWKPKRQTIDIDVEVSAIGFLHDFDIIVLATNGGSMRTLSFPSWNVVEEIQEHRADICDMRILPEAAHPRGTWGNAVKHSVDPNAGIVTSSFDATIKVWAVRSCEYDLNLCSASPYPASPLSPWRLTCVHDLTGHTRAVSALAVCGELAASSAADSTLRLWHLRSGRALFVHELRRPLTALALVDGSRLIGGSAGGKLSVYDPRARVAMATAAAAVDGSGRAKKRTSRNRAHDDAIKAIGCHDNTIATAALDGWVKTWDIRRLKAPVFAYRGDETKDGWARSARVDAHKVVCGWSTGDITMHGRHDGRLWGHLDAAEGFYGCESELRGMDSGEGWVLAAMTRGSGAASAAAASKCGARLVFFDYLFQ